MCIDMKRIAVLCLVVAGLLFCGKADAQVLKLGVDGLSVGEDSTYSKDVVYTHTIMSVKKKRGSTAFYIGGSKRSSISGFELGWNMAQREIPGDFFDLHNWKSNQVTLNCFNLGATNRRGNLGLSMALGIRANNYRFNDAITMENVGGNVNPVPLVGKVKKSKFTTAEIHVPMEMTFGNPRMMALSVGGFADLNFNSHTKIKYQDGNKVKDHKFPVNFIQAGLSARISCKYFSIYCNWYPGGVFKDGQGPKMQVWSVGIGL